VPITGGTFPKTLATGLGWPESLAVDATRVYFTDHWLGVVGSVPVAGAGAATFTTLAAFQSPNPYADWYRSLALGQGALYWINWDMASSSASILSLAVVGGTPKTVVGPVHEDLGGAGLGAPGLGGPIAMANTLYWTDWTGALQSMPLGGGPVTPVGPGPSFGGLNMVVGAFAVAPTLVAWGSYQSWLFTMPLAGGPGVTLTKHVGANQEGIVVDEANVYWTVYHLPDDAGQGGPGAIRKAPVGGGPITTIAADQDLPTVIVADAGAVYWLTRGSSAPGTGAVMKIAK
jgi:hypothetical protein